MNMKIGFPLKSDAHEYVCAYVRQATLIQVNCARWQT